MADIATRHDWSRAEVAALFALPFNELLHRAHSVHREHHDPNAVQVSTLLSIKTGGCPEDCAYCPQAARYDTGVQAQKLMSVEAVLYRYRVLLRLVITRIRISGYFFNITGTSLSPVLSGS